jgi:hypothetical protein
MGEAWLEETLARSSAVAARGMIFSVQVKGRPVGTAFAAVVQAE